VIFQQKRDFQIFYNNRDSTDNPYNRLFYHILSFLAGILVITFISNVKNKSMSYIINALGLHNGFFFTSSIGGSISMVVC